MVSSVKFSKHLKEVITSILHILLGIEKEVTYPSLFSRKTFIPKPDKDITRKEN